jgi:hypothetical protein
MVGASSLSLHLSLLSLSHLIKNKIVQNRPTTGTGAKIQRVSKKHSLVTHTYTSRIYGTTLSEKTFMFCFEHLVLVTFLRHAECIILLMFLLVFVKLVRMPPVNKRLFTYFLTYLLISRLTRVG